MKAESVKNALRASASSSKGELRRTAGAQSAGSFL